MHYSPFRALTLVAGWQEGHLACKNLTQKSPKILLWVTWSKDTTCIWWAWTLDKPKVCRVSWVCDPSQKCLFLYRRSGPPSTIWFLVPIRVFLLNRYTCRSCSSAILQGTPCAQHTNRPHYVKSCVGNSLHITMDAVLAMQAKINVKFSKQSTSLLISIIQQRQ